MTFSELIENPTETVLLTWLIGIILSKELDAGRASVLGRLIIDIGEAFVTKAVILAAREAATAEQNSQVADTASLPAECPIDILLNLISDLYNKNNSLQEQICELQLAIADLQSRINR